MSITAAKAKKYMGQACSLVLAELSIEDDAAQEKYEKKVRKFIKDIRSDLLGLDGGEEPDPLT